MARPAGKEGNGRAGCSNTNRQCKVIGPFRNRSIGFWFGSGYRLARGCFDNAACLAYVLRASDERIESEAESKPKPLFRKGPCSECHVRVCKRCGSVCLVFNTQCLKGVSLERLQCSKQRLNQRGNWLGIYHKQFLQQNITFPAWHPCVEQNNFTKS